MLVLRGEAGIGKTALLEFAAERATGCRVARAVGVQAEMELAFAGLHQLCAPLLDGMATLPGAAAAGAAGRVRTAGRRAAGPLPRRAGRAEPAGRGGRDATARVPRRGRAVARSRLRAGARVRRPAPAGGAHRDGLRRPRAVRRRRARRPARAARRRPRPPPTPARCWRPSCPGSWMRACATGSSPRRAATRSRCSSCRAG